MATDVIFYTWLVNIWDNFIFWYDLDYFGIICTYFYYFYSYIKLGGLSLSCYFSSSSIIKLTYGTCVAFLYHNWIILLFITAYDLFPIILLPSYVKHNIFPKYYAFDW